MWQKKKSKEIRETKISYQNLRELNLMLPPAQWIMRRLCDFWCGASPHSIVYGSLLVLPSSWRRGFRYTGIKSMSGFLCRGGFDPSCCPPATLSFVDVARAAFAPWRLSPSSSGGRHCSRFQAQRKSRLNTSELFSPRGGQSSKPGRYISKQNHLLQYCLWW